MNDFVIASMKQRFDLFWPKQQQTFQRRRAEIAMRLGSMSVPLTGSPYPSQLKKLGEEVLQQVLQSLLEHLKQAVDGHGWPKDHREIDRFVEVKLGSCADWINGQLQIARIQSGNRSALSSDWEVASEAVVRESKVEVSHFFQVRRQQTPPGLKGFWLRHWKWIIERLWLL